MHILFLNRSFYPDIEATGQLTTELAESLVKRGYEVTAIAGRSNYVQQNEYLLIQKENYNGINIIRTAGTILPKRFLFFRLINLATYFIMAFFSGLFLKNKPDVIIAQTDPPLISLIGYFLSKVYNAKFIYYCQDIYPDVGIVSGRLRNPILNFILEKSNIFSYKVADKIIVIGKSMKERLINKGVDKSKIEIIHNWADVDNIYPVEKKDNPFIHENNLEKDFIVMYSGNIGLTQNLEGVINVAESLKDFKDIKFVFIGDGANKIGLEKLIKDKNITNIKLLPYQKKEDLKYSLSAADIHLIPFQKGLSGILIPSKIYNILFSGRPFIGWIDENSEISDIAHEYKCGLIVPPEDEKLLREGIIDSYKNKEKNYKLSLKNIEQVKMIFGKEMAVNKFEKIFSKY